MSTQIEAIKFLRIYTTPFFSDGMKTYLVQEKKNNYIDGCFEEIGFTSFQRVNKMFKNHNLETEEVWGKIFST